MESIADLVKEIISEQLGVDREKFTPETNIVNDLGADSLDCVEIIMQIEHEFDIVIPDDVAERTTTVGQAIAVVEEAVA